MKMLSAVAAVLLLTFSGQSFAGGKVIGNGGDSRAYEFFQSAKIAIEDITKNISKYPEIKNIDLAAQLAKTEILVSDVPVYSLKGDVRQFSTAINYKDPDTIVVYGAQWSSVKNMAVRQALALHEVLSLAELENTGVYTISQRYLASLGIECAVGLCENLPRYICSLTKMPHNTNIPEFMGAERVGYSMTTNEIVDIKKENIQATIVMNTAAANGHIMLLMYQNRKTVGLTELRGSNFPTKLDYKWKDVEQNTSWTISCEQKTSVADYLAVVPSIL